MSSNPLKWILTVQKEYVVSAPTREEAIENFKRDHPEVADGARFIFAEPEGEPFGS